MQIVIYFELPNYLICITVNTIYSLLYYKVDDYRQTDLTKILLPTFFICMIRLNNYYPFQNP